MPRQTTRMLQLGAVFLCGVVYGWLFLPSGRPATGPTTFDVTAMTFNLRYAGGNDGSNSWHFRQDHVASIVNSYHPMILATQEGLADQLTNLAQAIHPFYRRFGVPRDLNDEFVQIFWDTRYFQLVRGDNFWLSDTPDVPHSKGWDAACVRLCTWVELEHLDTKRRLYVFNTQFDHVGERSRIAAAMLMADRMQAIVADSDTPVLLMGDFNTYRHVNPGPHAVLTSYLSDAWVTAQSKIGWISNTYHAWKGPLIPKDRGETAGYGHIDWILYQPRSSKVWMTKVVTETGPHGKYPSDHYPVVSMIEFLTTN